MRRDVAESVSRVLRAPCSDFSRLNVLADLNAVADAHTHVGIISAARLVSRVLQCRQQKEDPLVHQRVLNTFVPKVCSNAALLPTSVAMSTFNQFGRSGLHREGMRMLAQIQDKWFEGWKESAVEKSTKRPKKKLDMSGIYSSEGRMRKLGRCVFVESTDDKSLEEAVKIVQSMHAQNAQSMEYLQMILRAIVREHESRLLKQQVEIPITFQEFKSKLDSANS
jgi:hypothetical protein